MLLIILQTSLIAFFLYVCVCESLSHVRLFAIPWTPALQADSFPSEPLRKPSLQGILPIYLQGPKTQCTEQRRVYSELEKLGSVLGLSFKSHLAFFFEIVFPAIWETWVQSLGFEDPLEKGMATIPVFWLGDFHGLYLPWGRKELDSTERFSLSHL